MTEVILPTALRRAPSWPHFIDGEMYLWTPATVITSLCPHSCLNEPGLHFVLVYGGLVRTLSDLHRWGGVPSVMGL